ncbi:MAG TPA: hypothetical protein DEG69_08980 [Flavobacteriaceae bacterium]|nr:hypothetical protein [Flavobacteriaceae bacterium]
MREQAVIAKSKGHKNLFFDERKKGGNATSFVSKMTKEVNRVDGLRDLMKPFENILGRQIKGASDFRKLIPSILASELGYTDQVSVLMGHQKFDEILGTMEKITRDFYVSPIVKLDPEAQKVATPQLLALRAIQNKYAEVLGLKNVNELGSKFRLKLPNLTNEGSPKISIVKKGESVDPKVSKVENFTVDDVESNNKVASLTDDEIDLKQTQVQQEKLDADIALAERLQDPEVQETLVEGEKAKLRIEQAKRDITKEATAQIKAETPPSAPTDTDVDLNKLSKFLKKMRGPLEMLGPVGVGVGAMFLADEIQADIKKGEGVFGTSPNVSAGLRTAKFAAELTPPGMAIPIAEIGAKAQVEEGTKLFEQAYDMDEKELLKSFGEFGAKTRSY